MTFHPPSRESYILGKDFRVQHILIHMIRQRAQLTFFDLFQHPGKVFIDKFPGNAVGDVERLPSRTLGTYIFALLVRDVTDSMPLAVYSVVLGNVFLFHALKKYTLLYSYHSGHWSMPINLPSFVLCLSRWHIKSITTRQERQHNLLLLWHWDNTVPYRVGFVNRIVVGRPSAGYLLTS